MADRLMKNRFTLTDYLDQLRSLKGMGSMEDLAGMIPGMDAKALKGAKIDPKAMATTEAIILSMTAKERNNPAILNASRKKRIAAGSGTSVVEINRLLKNFDAMGTMVRQMAGGGSKKMRRLMKQRGMPGIPGF
jgi:signal recognition particle subunit SRP54